MSEIFHLINSMAPFLLLGFFLAGLMHAFVPGKLYQQHLGSNSFKSILYATLIAIPLPLCSCGVIPTAMSLRKEGASKGAVISFLIATPQTGVDSILATYSLMGLPFAIVRPIAALVTALFGGQLANVLEKKLNDNDKDEVISVVEDRKGTGFWEKMKIALHYAFFEMMQDIGKWLVLGLIIAGLITIYVPDSFFGQFSDNTLLSILVVLLFAIPMYLCATGSIPIAIALMLKGLSPGAALVLLMAGPAVNMASILVIHKVMGWRTLAVYLFSIVLGSTLFALGIDYLFPRSLFIDPLIANSEICHTGVPYFRWACTVLLFVLLFNALVKRFFIKKVTVCDCQSCENTASVSSVTEPSVIISIEGMKCNHCRTNVEKAIASIEGVTFVEADLQSATATIEGHFKLEEVVKSVEDLGFKVVKTLMNPVQPVVIRIEGMKCNHCRTNVEKAIASVEGVKSVEADLQSATATIDGQFDLEEVIKSVEDLGFTVIRDSSDSVPTVVIKIEGMKCNHCRTNVEKAIASIDGVKSVKADLQSSTATIEGVFNLEEVIKSVEDLGFTVERD